MKKIFSFIVFQLICLQLLIADHKPNHNKGGGGEKGKGKNVPEIDDYALLAIIVIFIGFYFIYLYHQKNKNLDKSDD